MLPGFSADSLQASGLFWESGHSTEKRALHECPFFLTSYTFIFKLPPSSFSKLNRAGR